jgi:hypothetical protein
MFALRPAEAADRIRAGLAEAVSDALQSLFDPLSHHPFGRGDTSGNMLTTSGMNWPFGP